MALEVGCSCQAPAVVRAALTEVPGLGAARDDLTLVTSELVTNAVVHSGGLPTDTIHVQAVLSQGNVSISVRDPGRSDNTPQLRNAGVLRAGGMGLRIVDRLARRWGFERQYGSVVWAELALRPRPGSQPEVIRARTHLRRPHAGPIGPVRSPMHSGPAS